MSRVLVHGKYAGIMFEFKCPACDCKFIMTSSEFDGGTTHMDDISQYKTVFHNCSCPECRTNINFAIWHMTKVNDRFIRVVL